MTACMTITHTQPDHTSADFAGCTPTFPALPGATLQTGLRLASFQPKRLIFNRLGQPGQVHVYVAECRAGERLRVQMLAPKLPVGATAVPAFAVVAQSLPYSADMQKLPFSTPAGFSAVVATPPTQLTAPVKDVLTRVRYYLGPIIDTRTLIGGRAYIVVWSPHNHMGKYVLQVGQRWPLQWRYWVQLPIYWWRIRGWFGQSRAVLVGAVAGAVLLGALAIGLLRRGRRD